MLADLATSYPLIQSIFAQASAALGYDLWQLVQEGPVDVLNQTEYTQPALLATSVALWRILQAQGKQKPRLLAGHSLGEYSALVCSEAIAFDDGLRLVQKRGQMMQYAVAEGEGAMAAILGASWQVVQEICRDACQDDGQVYAANYNTPEQIVISGHRTAVLRAIDLSKQRGAKRGIVLPVSAPSHCPLMQPAADAMQEALQHIEIKMPLIPVLHNVDIDTHCDPDDIRECLIAQLLKPVRWVETIQALDSANIKTVIECGPGQVLQGLSKKITAHLPVINAVELLKIQEE